MLSIRFSGPIQAIQELRDAMRPAGAIRVGFKANNDQLTARLYVDFSPEASAAIIDSFRSTKCSPASVVIEGVVEAEPAQLNLPVEGERRYQITWRR